MAVTPTEVFYGVIALSTLLNALGNWRNGKKIARVEQATNGLVEKLVVEAKAGSLAIGMAAGVEQEHSRVLAESHQPQGAAPTSVSL